MKMKIETVNNVMEKNYSKYTILTNQAKID